MVHGKGNLQLVAQPVLEAKALYIMVAVKMTYVTFNENL